MAEHQTISMACSNEGTRNEVRMRPIEYFKCEDPGDGPTRDFSRYTYEVEEMANGEKINLRRPGTIHGGFDFVVRVEGHNFAKAGCRQRFAPKHEDILEDLREKVKAEPQKKQELFKLLKRVYECHDVADSDARALQFKTGMPTEMILKLLKWLWIEQDIRCWSQSGRWMLWKNVCDIFGVAEH